MTQCDGCGREFYKFQLAVAEGQFGKLKRFCRKCYKTHLQQHKELEDYHFPNKQGGDDEETIF